MYSTENKKIHYFYNGIFYTRSINEFVNDILFQKIYGGEGLLKKILKETSFMRQEPLKYLMSFRKI